MNSTQGSSTSTGSVADHSDLITAAKQGLRETGALFFQRGWSVGTSSNYSVVLDKNPLRILITASGKDKGRLGMDDFVIVDENAVPVAPGAAKPSAETWLHVVAAQQPGVGSILHTHSVWGTILSDLYFNKGEIGIEGYEMLKGLAGIHTHDTRVFIDIFENTQDIPLLAKEVARRFTEKSLKYGFLMRKHGLYTWGRDVAEARRHVEILEFLFEVLGRRLGMEPRA